MNLKINNFVCRFNSGKALIRFSILLIILLLYIPERIIAQLPAFPGAEGGGMYTSGGRNGKVIEVTNLNDSGTGSLREAINTFGPRIIVFRVSGTIILKSQLSISKGDVTIAGQTAPGDGICIRDYPLSVNANNVIVRYIRVRLGDVNKLESDAFGGINSKKNIIIDHCSISWSIDEAASFYSNENFTMQWCLISESLYHSYHSKGDHGYGAIWGGNKATFHHNLFAHHSSRNPRFQGGRESGIMKEFVDMVNNVIYNWGFNSAYGGESGNQNVRLNYYKYGPATDASKRNRILEPFDTASNWFVDGNLVYGSPVISADNWNGGVQGGYAAYQKGKKALTHFDCGVVNVQKPEDMYELVLKNAGAIVPKRDSLDTRIVDEVRTGTAHYGKTYGGGSKGIIDSQTDVGGWPALNTLLAPMDSDHDGMPDSWETANNMNLQDSTDRNKIYTDGYTMLEVYLKSLVPDFLADVKVHSDIPLEFMLKPNYPNPFNPVTKIEYSIPEDGNVDIRIYDITGKEVKKIITGFVQRGKHILAWSAGNNTGESVSAGIYLCAMKFNGLYKTQKLVLLK